MEVPLGESEVGSLWSGRAKEGGRRVVVVRLEDDAPAPLKERFQRDSALLVSLRHPNVVHALETGTDDDGTPFVVLELLEGETLAQRFTAGPALRVDRLVEISMKVGEALGAAHAVGLTHGDVEPGNVFLVGAAGEETPMLIGFALNRAQKRAEPPGERASLPTLQTQYAYAAPEQVRGEEIASPAIDVYGLGALLFAGLAGHPPHVAPDAAALLAAIGKGRAISLGTAKKELAAFSTILDRALSSDPKKRPENAAALVRGLKTSLALAKATHAATIPVGARSPIGTPPAAPVKAAAAMPKPRTIAMPGKPAAPGKPEAEPPAKAIEAAPAAPTSAKPAASKEDALSARIAGVPREDPSEVMELATGDIDVSPLREPKAAPPPPPPPAEGRAKPDAPPPPPPAPPERVAARSEDDAPELPAAEPAAAKDASAPAPDEKKASDSSEGPSGVEVEIPSLPPDVEVVPSVSDPGPPPVDIEAPAAVSEPRAADARVASAKEPPPPSSAEPPPEPKAEPKSSEPAAVAPPAKESPAPPKPSRKDESAPRLAAEPLAEPQPARRMPAWAIAIAALAVFGFGAGAIAGLMSGDADEPPAADRAPVTEPERVGTPDPEPVGAVPDPEGALVEADPAPAVEPEPIAEEPVVEEPVAEAELAPEVAPEPVAEPAPAAARTASSSSGGRPRASSSSGGTRASGEPRAGRTGRTGRSSSGGSSSGSGSSSGGRPTVVADPGF